MNFKLFGERVALEPVEQTYSGKVVLPQSAARVFDLGRVVAIGDGKVKDKTVPLRVKVGDTAVFQANMMVAHNCRHDFGPKSKFIFLLQQDLIAVLHGTEIKLERFQVVGHWVLLQPFDEVTGIIKTPDTATRPARYRAVQVGEDAPAELLDKEVIVEKTRVSKISIGDRELAFIHQANVMGVVED